MPTWFLAILFLIVWPSLAVAGLVWLRRQVGASTLKPHHEVAGFIVAVVGVVYGVALGSMVVAVWNDFEDARSAVATESGHLFTLHRLADGMPEADRVRLESAIMAYADSVVTDEWPAMAVGRVSQRTELAANRLWAAVRDFELSDEHAALLQDKALDFVSDVSEHRRLRILLSTTGLPPYLWLVLWAGAVVTVVFAYLFGVEPLRLHAVMIWLLALIIGLNLFVIAAVDLPFTGDIQVAPTGFDQLRSTLQQERR